MPRYRVEFECDEKDIDAVLADGRYDVRELVPDVVGSKYVGGLTVTDPDTGNDVVVEIRKMDTGPMVGFDGSFLEQLDEDENPFSPYDENTIVVVPEDEEGHHVDLIASAMEMDSSELADLKDQMEKFSP